MSAHLSQKELESYLWGAATLLRGLIDASDYKQYIFPLLFFKRLSDVWDEDYREAFEDSQDEGYATATANDRFTIPKGAHGKDARDTSRDVGRALLNAYQAIEAANPQRLQGVFGNAKFNEFLHRLDLGLGVMTAHGLGDVLDLGLAQTQLQGVVTVPVLGLLGNDPAIADFKHGHRHMGTVVNE